MYSKFNKYQLCKLYFNYKCIPDMLNSETGDKS